MDFLLAIHKKLLPSDSDFGYSPYVNLAYLFFFFIVVYLQPLTGYQIPVVVVGTLCFLICYFRAYWSYGKQTSYFIVAMCVIGVVMAQINWGASTFFIYAAAFTCMLGSKKRAFIGLFSVVLFVALYSLVVSAHVFFWGPGIFISLVVGLINIHQNEVQTKNRALKQSQEEIKILAETAERERISRDLHDLLGHSLSVITLKSELAGKMLEKGSNLKQVREEIKAVEELSRETLAQVRDAVKNYNKATLAGELMHAKVATDAANIELISDVQVKDLPQELESELALILREAITNVIRHAQTKKVWVNLHYTDANSNANQTDKHAKQLVLTVRDEGTMDSQIENSGMRNMQTRIAKLKGKMNIVREPTTELQFCCDI